MRLRPLPEVLFARIDSSPGANRHGVSAATPGDIRFIARKDGKPVMAGRYELVENVRICHAITAAPKSDPEQASLGEECPAEPKTLPKVLFYRTTYDFDTSAHGWCASVNPADLAYMGESVFAGRYELVEEVIIDHAIAVSTA